MMVKPVNPAAVIRDPITKRQLPADGGEVPESNFWVRRLRAGEVVVIDKPDAAAPAANVDKQPAAPVAPLNVAAPVAPLTTR